MSSRIERESEMLHNKRVAPCPSSSVLPVCVSKVAAVTLSWPDCALQRHRRLADARAEHRAVLHVRVITVQSTLKTEEEHSTVNQVK